MHFCQNKTTWHSSLSPLRFTDRSSMERIRMPPEETMPQQDSYTTSSDDYDYDDNHTPNSSQHQEYHPINMEQQPHHAIGSAV